MKVARLIGPEAERATFVIAAEFGKVVDHGLDHRDRGGVERRFGAADLADDLGDLGDSGDSGVERPQRIDRLLDRSVRTDRRHEEERPLVE